MKKNWRCILLIFILFNCNKTGNNLFKLIDTKYNAGNEIINLEENMLLDFDNIWISVVPFSDGFINRFINFYDFFPHGVDVESDYIVFEKNHKILYVERVNRISEDVFYFHDNIQEEVLYNDPSGDKASSNSYFKINNMKIFRITKGEKMLGDGISYILTKP